MEFLKNYIDLIIFIILGLMAFIALYCLIERLLFFRKVKKIHRSGQQPYPDQDALENALSENLTTIYIIYSNAPYVGLLGTVVGIMITFYDMGLSGSMDVKATVLGLSLALKATALGLLVAIPALMVYNALLRKIALLASELKIKAQGA